MTSRIAVAFQETYIAPSLHLLNRIFLQLIYWLVLLATTSDGVPSDTTYQMDASVFGGKIQPVRAAPRWELQHTARDSIFIAEVRCIIRGVQCRSVDGGQSTH